MIETLIITILGNLIVLGISVGIIAIYLRNKAQQLENDDSQLPIQDIFSEFLKQSTDEFRKELESEAVQVMIATSVMEGITTLFSDEKNQSQLTNFISSAVQQSLSTVFPAITNEEPMSPSEVKTLDKESDSALGALTVNTIVESLPPGYGMLLDKVYPKWQEDAQKRPKDFIALVQKANQYGLFNIIPGMSGGSAPVSTNQSARRF